MEVSKRSRTKMPDQPLRVFSGEQFEAAPAQALQHDRVYSIQVGFRLFKLSGLSLSSDAPSYFTRFFSQVENEDKVLFIDRDPKVFERIYNHLQGYALNMECAFELVNVWSDAYYFGLKGLQSILINGDIYCVVGNQLFKVCRKLLQTFGNTPNFFTINHDSLLVDSLAVIERQKMLRPPPQYPAITNRSPKLFSDLLELLLGNNLVITDKNHRQLLVRECKYYRFLELEQHIINHKIINNPYKGQEILINLNDLQYKGVLNDSPADRSMELPLKYARPYLVKEPIRPLLMQIDSEFDAVNNSYSQVKLVFNKSVKIATLQITDKHSKKLLAILKDYLPDLLTENMDTDHPKIIFPVGFTDSKAIINGLEMKSSWASDMLGIEDEEIFTVNRSDDQSKKRKLSKNLDGDIIQFFLTLSVWRVIMRGDRVRLHAVLIHGSTNPGAYNRANIDLL